MINTFPEYHCDPSKIDFIIESIINLDRNDYPIIEPDGTKSWRNKEGQLHRDDGPAIIRDRRKEYYKNGERHREDGPAVIYTSGKKEYWKHGIFIYRQD